jgi:hypothetical protein
MYLILSIPGGAYRLFSIYLSIYLSSARHP